MVIVVLAVFKLELTKKAVISNITYAHQYKPDWYSIATTLIMVTKKSAGVNEKNEALNGSRKQWSRCITWPLSFLRVYGAIPPCIGVKSWPRHPGLSSLLGWSSTSPHPRVG